MTPAVVGSQVVAGAVKGAGNTLKKIPKKTWVKVGAISAGAVIALFVALKVRKMIAGRKEKQKADAWGDPDNPYTRMAERLQLAFNPSGIPALINMDGTDEDAIYRAMQKLVDEGLSMKKLEAAYEGNLTDRLNSELDGDEYDLVQAIIEGKRRDPNESSLNGLLMATGHQPLPSLQFASLT